MHDHRCSSISIPDARPIAPRLLVVSPNMEMGARRHRLLLAAGYNPDTVSSATQALSLIHGDIYAALVLGQMLDFTNKSLLIQTAHALHIPVIAIHALPLEDSCTADYCVRITQGTQGLLDAIRQAILTPHPKAKWDT